MYTKINGIVSKTENVTVGSILGPLLFSIFINDMVLYVHNLTTILYADDTTLLYLSPNVDDIVLMLSNNLNLLLNWFRVNKLSINLSKSKFMLF